MIIERDLEEIKIRAKRNEEKNWKFRSFLKSRDDRRIDGIVRRLYREISESIDCTQCGNCCRELKPLITSREIKLLSNFIHIPKDKFKEDYIECNEGGNFKIKGTPCPFLKDNKCMVYEYRPSACKSFPYLHKRGFTARLIDVIQNYAICPIVFNVYEQLKIELRFR